QFSVAKLGQYGPVEPIVENGSLSQEYGFDPTVASHEVQYGREWGCWLALRARRFGVVRLRSLRRLGQPVRHADTAKGQSAQQPNAPEPHADSAFFTKAR